MKLIKKLFIKNYRNINDPTVHHRYGVVAGTIGIILNTLIASIGIVIGLLTNSITIIIQSIGNLTDAGSSIISLVGIKNQKSITRFKNIQELEFYFWYNNFNYAFWSCLWHNCNLTTIFTKYARL